MSKIMRSYTFLLMLGAASGLTNLCLAEISTFKESTNEGLSNTEKFDRIEKYLVEVSNQFKNLENKIDGLQKRINKLDENASVQKSSIEKNTSVISGFSQDLNKLRIDLKELEKKI